MTKAQIQTLLDALWFKMEDPQIDMKQWRKLWASWEALYKKLNEPEGA